MKKQNKTPTCWEGNALCDTNFPLRREVPSRNRYHIFPQYASLRTGSTSWHEREINQSKTHPSTFTKTHTCARLHTTVRSVAFISQNKVSLRSRGLKKKTKKKNQNNNRNYIWCLTVGKTHQHAGVGTTAWQIRRRFGEKSSKHRTACRKWGQKRKSHNSVLGSRTTIRFLREATSCSASLWAEELSTGFATCLTTKGDCLDYTFSYQLK